MDVPALKAELEANLAPGTHVRIIAAEELGEPVSMATARQRATRRTELETGGPARVTNTMLALAPTPFWVVFVKEQ